MPRKQKTPLKTDSYSKYSRKDGAKKLAKIIKED